MRTPDDAGADLSVELAGVRLPSPFVLASGILGTHASLMARVARAGAGAVTMKSAGPGPRPGHPNPTCVDFGAGLLNAVGLANPGVEAEVGLVAETRRLVSPLGVKVIASVFADTAVNGEFDGLFFGGGGELLKDQFVAAASVAAFSFVATYLIATVIQRTMGLRVSTDDELLGLDQSQHSESAYTS